MQKRKKILWACNHCNKAHVTCDSGRPCSRCIKKGLQDTCADAPRKRKKYLADVQGPVIQRTLNASPQQGEGSRPESPNMLFQMDSSSSIKTESDFGPGPGPQLYQATQFQHSTSLPDFLLPRNNSTSGSPAISINESRKPESPSLFSRPSYEGNYLLSSNTPHSDLGRNRNQAHDQNRLFEQKPMNGQCLPIQKDQNYHRTGDYEPGLRDGEYNSALRHEEAQTRTQNSLPQSIHHQKKGSNRGQTAQEKKRPNFLSSAADMEYATLSSILQDNFMGFTPNYPLTSSEGTPASVNNISPALSPHAYDKPKVSPPSSLVEKSYGSKNSHKNSSHPEEQAFHGPGLPENDYNNSSEFPPFDARINQYFLGNTTHYHNVRFPAVSEAMEFLKQNNPALYYSRNSKSTLSLTMGFDTSSEKSRNLLFEDPEEIYVKIKKPFSYTPGFHKLIAYLRGRFPREMLVKMAESMAVYRPSFIACTNSLRESDLIFMEQCFQRTLLTYDNFIKVSGTPTIVWRRTGEIAYVGDEFTTLTGWTSEHLLGGKPTFIVELLDDKSVVEYFQLFSKIAFGDFLGATMTECTLLTPQDNVKIRAGCSWTMKRDVFGIPMMIIGNFLPIL